MTSLTGVRKLKLIAIGNSRGTRLPKAMREKYGWSDSLVVEETEDGVLLRSGTVNKLSWEDTYRSMAAEREDCGGRRRPDPHQLLVDQVLSEDYSGAS